MPYHSLGDKFVGRIDSLWQLYDLLHRDSTAVLQGTGVVVGTGGLGRRSSPWSTFPGSAPRTRAEFTGSTPIAVSAPSSRRSAAPRLST